MNSINLNTDSQDLILLLYIRRQPDGQLGADFRFNPSNTNEGVKALQTLHFALDQIENSITKECRARKQKQVKM